VLLLRICIANTNNIFTAQSHASTIYAVFVCWSVVFIIYDMFAHESDSVPGL